MSIRKAMKKCIVISDSFKGSLSSGEICEIARESFQNVFPACKLVCIPVADGGEGTVACFQEVCGGELVTVRVQGPFGQSMEASYLQLEEKQAVIEMAACAGLPLANDCKDPRITTTYGVGQLIRHAVERGNTRILLGLGGSATNDGGMGAMSALGVRFLDAEGNVLTGVGSDLEKVADIDMSGLHPAVAEAEITVMCDVTNPLTGPDGATYTFGKQKGGTPEILDRLEAGMKKYAALMREKGMDVENQAGAGAAGGLGAALCGYLKANLKSGIETVLDLIDFDGLLEGTDLVVTGEGRIDWQSAFGKVPSGIGMRCKAKGVPAVAIVGGMGNGAEKIYDFGVESIIPTINGAMDIEEALERAEELYANAADRTFRMIRVGMQMK